MRPMASKGGLIAAGMSLIAAVVLLWRLLVCRLSRQLMQVQGTRCLCKVQR